MSRGLTYCLMVALCCLLTLPAVGQAAIDPNDDFDDGVIDATKWIATSFPEGNGSVEERDGRLVMTRGTGEYCRDDLWSQWVLQGAFDVQVDYQLLEWPESPYLGAHMTVASPSDYATVCRYQYMGWERYQGSYITAGECICAGENPTADMAGTLRLVRDADFTMTEYYWSAETSSWIPFASGSLSGDARICLAFDTIADHSAQIAFDNFQINSGEAVPLAPVIEDVMIDRGRDTDWWDWARYHQRVTVQVKGHQYEQPACVIIDDPDGSQYVISTCNPVGWYDWVGANTPGFAIPQLTVGPDCTYTYTWYEGRKWQPLLPGPYQITVIGNNGNQPVLITPPAPAVPEEGPVLMGPAVDGVVDTTVPTFEWLSPPGSENWLQLRAEGETSFTGPVADDEAEIWRAYVGEQTMAEYNFDGSGPGLDPGRTYFWQVNSWTPVDDRVSDPLVSIWNEQTARHRFTIEAEWPPRPELPGRLAYAQVEYGGWSLGFDNMAIAQYGPTVDTRTWIGPYTSECPDFSWDGSKLQYRLCDAGTWIDNLDGSMPTRVPDNDSWADSSLSPDATSIVYCEATDPNWVLEVWTQKLDGSDKRLLVPARGIQARRPHWSPDGVWIAYSSCCDPSGYNVWLIRPDGTQDHPVIPTALAGYPGWTVTWFANGSFWSPDALRLVGGFYADSPDGSTGFGGLATVSRDGGEMTPVWVDPPGNVCCAASFPNAWSPNGESIVFSSGHHLAPDPEWLDGKFEPGIELWLAPADGSGPPLRLTYDYSYANGVSWWAPNTPVGNGVSVVKGKASVTFAQVTAEGSTRMNVTDDVPGPAPEGYAFASDVWSGATTASYQGDITVALPYDASVDGEERALVLMQWNPVRGKWQNITARPIDVANHVIRGRTRSLSTFVACTRTR